MLNKVMLIGNIGKDVEGKALNTGTYIANTSLATTSTYKGEKQTEWHNLVFFGKTAEIASQYVRKGSKIYVEGRIQTRSWDDKEGVKQYRTEVIANNLVLLDPKGDKPLAETVKKASKVAHRSAPDFDADVPF